MSRKSVTILGVKIPLSNLTPVAVAPTDPYTHYWISSDGSSCGTYLGAAGRMCDCALRSFWEGDCDFCRDYQAPPEPAKSYNDYCNFSTFAVDNSFGNDIMEAAREAGAEYARRLNKLVEFEVGI
jgi:hypothetical protein